MHSGLKRVVLVAALLTFSPRWTLAEDSRWSAGVRHGFSATSYDDPFHQTELFGILDLPHHPPWRFATDSGWYIQSRVIGSAGALSGQNQTGFVGSLGASIIFGQKHFPLYLDTGISPTFLSRDEFGSVNFGMPYQFTTYGGLYLRYARISVGYRVQHMSNAHLAEPNPGLDLHVIGITYHF